MAQVLIIEDETNLRGIIRSILEEAGHDVTEACDGSEIAELLADHVPDLVITDILMPEKEGIQTIIELHRNCPSLKIIGMSGGGMEGPEHYLDMAKEFGADTTLRKPFNKEKLLKTVNSVLQTNVTESGRPVT
jgi:CheY-like chemotaxis protein